MSAQILHGPVRKHEEHRAAARRGRADSRVGDDPRTQRRRWLDAKYGSDWDRRIDFDRLEIGSPIRCVVGQLIRHGYLSMLFATQIVAHGFSRGLLDVVVILLPIGPVKRAYRPLTDAWKVVLRERRGPARAAREACCTRGTRRRCSPGRRVRPSGVTPCMARAAGDEREQNSRTGKGGEALWSARSRACAAQASRPMKTPFTSNLTGRGADPCALDYPFSTATAAATPAH